MRPSPLGVVAVTLLAVVVGTSSYSQGQAQNQAPRPACSRADEAWVAATDEFIAAQKG